MSGSPSSLEPTRLAKAQGWVLIAPCIDDLVMPKIPRVAKRLLRGIVPTRERKHLKTSSQTGRIRLGLVP